MKTINFSIWAAALASLVLISCSKEQELQIGNQEDNPVEMVTLKFKAEKAGADTKTSANIDAVNNKVSYTWTDEDEDNITVYLVDGSDLTPVTATVSKTSDTQLSIIAEVPKADSYTIRAVLAREFYAKGKPMVSKYQSPANDNFDPYGDILFSDDEDIVTTGDLTDELLLTFNRKVSVNKMTLRSLGAGEKVSKVEISSDKDLVGYFDGTDLVPVADSKTIVLSYDNVTVPASGVFPVYFTCMEMAGHTLTVTVTTDAKTYTKTFGAGEINFALGKFLTFGVTMPAGVSYTWNLVTSSSTDLAADDVIVIANEDADYALGAQNGTKFRDAISVTSSADKTIIASIPGTVNQITLESATGGWYLPVGTKYLYANGGTSSNYLNEADKGTAGDYGIWAIDVDSDGIATIISQGSTDANARIDMRYNYNNGDNPRFACYKTNTTQPPVRVYRKTTKDATVWNLFSLAVTNQPTTKTYTTGEAFDPTGMVVKATFKEYGGLSEKVVTLAPSDYTVSPTVLSAGETTVTLSYLNQTTEVTGLTVSDIDYSTAYTSSLSISNGTQCSDATIVISSSNYSGKKLGKSGAGGNFTVTVPAGSSKLHVHAAGWLGKSPSLKVTPEANVDSTNPVSITADTGVSGSSSTFTLGAPSKANSDYYITFDLKDITSSKTLTVASLSERAVIWGVHVE